MLKFSEQSQSTSHRNNKPLGINATKRLSTPQSFLNSMSAGSRNPIGLSVSPSTPEFTHHSRQGQRNVQISASRDDLDTVYYQNCGLVENEPIYERLRGSWDVLSVEDGGFEVRVSTVRDDWVGRSPLHVAAQNNHLDVLKTLVTPAFDWSSSLDSLGCTPLHLAAVHGHLDVVKLLIKENCPINYQNQFGNTALHEASYRGHAKVVKYLIQKKGEKSIQNQDGSQAIHLACQSGHLETLKVLLKSGADPNVKNISGDNCVHICVRYNQLTTFKYLSTSSSATSSPASLKFEEPNAERNSPLHVAVQYNRKQFVSALLDFGASAILLRNQQGETALDIANRLGYDDLIPTSSILQTISSDQHPNLDHHHQSKQPSNDPHSTSGGSGATSGMKNLFRAATGRASSSSVAAPGKLSMSSSNRQQSFGDRDTGTTPLNVGGGVPPVGASATAADSAAPANETAGAKKESRSRSRGAPHRPLSPSRIRTASEGKALEHENSPAADLTQELSVEIDDDATKPTLGVAGEGVAADEQGIGCEEGGARDETDMDVRRHQRRSHKSKGKVPKKYVYDRGMYRRSRRFGASLSSLSTIDQHHHHHHHRHPSSRTAAALPQDPPRHHHEGGPSRHHHHRSQQGAGTSAGGGGLFTLYDGAYLTKPAKESSLAATPGEQRRRHRVNRTLEANEDVVIEHRGQHMSQVVSNCRCGCAKHIAALDAKVEFLKEAILDELKLSEEVTDKKIVDLDEKTTHQVACVDKLCRERISAERTECNHRMDRRALQERIVYSKELRKLELRMESTMKAWCEARYRRVNERIGSQMNFYPTLSSSAAASPGGTHRRRHSCSDVDPRNAHLAAAAGVAPACHDESGAETTNSSKSGYRDSGAFESNSKASSQDYPVAGSLQTTSGGESLGTTPSDCGPMLFGHPRSKTIPSSLVADSHMFSGFYSIDERSGTGPGGKYPNVFHNPSDDAESVVDNESVSQLPVLHGLPSDNIKAPSDFASLAIPPLLTKDVFVGGNKRSISAHSDEAKQASEEIMSQLHQNYGSIHHRDSKPSSSHVIKPPSYFRAASTSTTTCQQQTGRMSLSPLTVQRSQVRYSSVSGASTATTPSYQEVSAQLKAIQQQAMRSKQVRNSSQSDDRKSHDSSGSANGSVHDGKSGSGSNEAGISFATPVGSWDEKFNRQMSELELKRSEEMKRHYEKDQQVLRQRIKNLEQMLKSYQSPSGQNESEAPESSKPQSKN